MRLILFILITASTLFSTIGFGSWSVSQTPRGTALIGLVACFEIKKNMTSKNIIRFGFVGDVMIGRGIDAILPFSVDGMLHESYMKDASGYVNIAERATGPLPKVCMEKEGFSYIWGDVRNDLKSADALIVNLESSLTESNDWDRNKGIHYRSHPRNAESLSTIDVDVATLANNHVLDWGDTGLKGESLALRT